MRAGDVVSTDVIVDVLWGEPPPPTAGNAVQGHIAQLRRLLVIDDDRRLVGIVSLADIVQQTGDDTLGGETLERVTDPTGH